MCDCPVLGRGYTFKEIKGQFADRAEAETESTFLSRFQLLASTDKFLTLT